MAPIRLSLRVSFVSKPVGLLLGNVGPQRTAVAGDWDWITFHCHHSFLKRAIVYTQAPYHPSQYPFPVQIFHLPGFWIVIQYCLYISCQSLRNMKYHNTSRKTTQYHIIQSNVTKWQFFKLFRRLQNAILQKAQFGQNMYNVYFGEKVSNSNL